MKIIKNTIVLLLITLFSSHLWAKSSQEKPMQKNQLTNELTAIANTFPGKVGLYLHDLKTNEIITINADKPFPMASTFKIPILVQLYRDKDNGLLSLTDTVTLKESDIAPYGLLQNFTLGTSLALKDIALMMVTVSDNTATDILVNKLTPKRINATLQELAIKPMAVNRTTKEMIKASEDNPDYDPLSPIFELTTPRAMGTLMEKIVQCHATSNESCKEIKHILSQQKINGRMPRKVRHLEDINIGHKTGTTDWATNDVGYIEIPNRPEIVLCIYTLKNDKATPIHQAEEVIGELTEKVIQHFHTTTS